tara:strand:- start:5743 stop:6810 length:1068 start_codon:yes stop_codon:yes gene_type:complete
MKIKELFYQSKNTKIKLGSPYLIAEAGVNHGGNLNTAYQLIDEAQEGGADAIKFQTYKADTIASKNSPAYWDLSQEPTSSQYQLFKRYDKFWKEEFEKLKKHCDIQGIEFLSTPFDLESANFLNDLMDVFKISSSDITNKPFIKYICNFGKPIILSTGASNLPEIHKTVDWIKDSGNDLALLHCILNYPTDDRNAHLNMISDLKEHFSNEIIGYSDHTLPKDMKVLEYAHLLGANIIEKHFTHDKTLPGNDHYHAMDKTDLIVFRQIIKRLNTLLGSSKQKHSIETEEISRINARRSIVLSRPVKKNNMLTEGDLTCKRPGTGISPAFWDEVVGMKVIRDLEYDEVLNWEDLVHE